MPLSRGHPGKAVVPQRYSYASWQPDQAGVAAGWPICNPAPTSALLNPRHAVAPAGKFHCRQASARTGFCLPLGNSVPTHMNRATPHMRRAAMHVNRPLIWANRAPIHANRSVIHMNRLLNHPTRDAMHMHRGALHMRCSVIHISRRGVWAHFPGIFMASAAFRDRTAFLRPQRM